MILETPTNVGSGANGGESLQGDNRVPTRVCSYKDFMNIKPKPFYGNEGVFGLTMWIENMELVFEISFCPEVCNVKSAACILADAALSW